MAYTTLAQIRQEAGFQNNSNVTDSVITDKQSNANAVVNGYVSRRYTLSQLSGALFTGSQAEQLLEHCERLIAAGNLLLEEYAGQPMGETNGKEKIDRAMKLLEDISSGKLKLLNVNGDEFSDDVPSSSGGTPEYTAPPRVNSNPVSSENKFSVDTIF